MRETKALDVIKLDSNICTADNKTYFSILYGFVFFLPTLIMLTLYGKILKIALSHAKTMDTRRVTIRTSEQRRRSSLGFITQSNFFANRRLEFRATKVVLVVYGTFIVCWLPIVSLTVATIIKPDLSYSSFVYVLFGDMLPIINSILNPFIYGILHRDFKHGIKRILGILYLQHHIGRGSNQKKLAFDLSSMRTLGSTYLTTNDSHIGSPSPSPMPTARSTILDTTQESDRSINEIDNHIILSNNDKKLSLTDSEKTCSSDEQNPLLKLKSRNLNL